MNIRLLAQRTSFSKYRNVIRVILFFAKGDKRYANDLFDAVEWFITQFGDHLPNRRKARWASWIHSQEKREKFVSQWTPKVAEAVSSAFQKLIEEADNALAPLLDDLVEHLAEINSPLFADIMDLPEFADSYMKCHPLPADAPWDRHEEVIEELQSGIQLAAYAKPSKYLNRQAPEFAMPALKTIAGNPTPEGVSGILEYLRLYAHAKKCEFSATRKMSENLSSEGFRRPGFDSRNWKHIARIVGVNSTGSDSHQIPAEEIYRNAYVLIDRARVTNKQTGGSEMAAVDPDNISDASTLPQAVRIAWASWKLAESAHSKWPTDKVAYDWLKELADDRFVGELAGYSLPSFDTWSKYVRQARSHFRENKNTRRAGRATGSSIVRQAER